MKDFLEGDDFGFTTHDIDDIQLPKKVDQKQIDYIEDNVTKSHEMIMKLLKNLINPSNNKEYIKWPYEKRKEQIEVVIKTLETNKKNIEKTLKKLEI